MVSVSCTCMPPDISFMACIYFISDVMYPEQQNTCYNLEPNQLSELEIDPNNITCSMEPTILNVLIM